MKITIEIPEPFINKDDTMVIIEGGNFKYVRSDMRHHGLAHDCAESENKERYRDMMYHCDEIAYNIVQMVKKKLI